MVSFKGKVKCVNMFQINQKSIGRKRWNDLLLCTGININYLKCYKSHLKFKIYMKSKTFFMSIICSLKIIYTLIKNFLSILEESLFFLFSTLDSIININMLKVPKVSNSEHKNKNSPKHFFVYFLPNPMIIDL